MRVKFVSRRTEDWGDLKKGTGSHIDVREAVASFPTILLGDMINVDVWLLNKAFRMLTAPCVQRLHTSVRSGSSGSPCDEARRWFWISATRPRQECGPVHTTQQRSCPGCGSQPQRPTAYVCLWHRQFAGRSELGKGCSTPHSSTWRGSTSYGAFCAIFLPSSIRSSLIRHSTSSIRSIVPAGSIHVMIV
jgi:hypothetical protein